MINKKRYYSLDFIKIIAIFLVCFYHFTTISRNLAVDKSINAHINYYVYGIGSVCVPLFFMVNGALTLNRDFDLKKHLKKLTTLVILIFLWGAIQLLIYAIIKGDNYTIKGFIYALLDWRRERIDSLWFLQTLICLYIIFPVVKLIYDQEDKTLLKYTLIIVGFFTFGVVLINMGINVIQYFVGKENLNRNFINLLTDPFNPFKGFRAYSLIYFISGGLIVKAIEEKKFKLSNSKLIFILLISLLILFLYGSMMTIRNSYLYDTVWNGYDTVMTFFICVVIFILSFRYEERLAKVGNIIKLIGTNTLGIYLLQGMVGAYFKPIYMQIPFNSNLIMNIVFATFIVLVCLSITLTMKKIPLVKKLFEL
ncbi:acyltransferase [Romboutsia sp. 1001216sp1]|uniref:acyltransferase n=1 Tax=unclassified Romboutsia TaxID=2626894 RepID=UPI00189D9E1A|nr:MULTISPECIES: acyltransferase [unclassified Romboutsia]MDB8789363.1 acyltransferase [Romboutsia sp. 1001216sp1]MDB8802063.1 acyltransferase [Romboutsia sp. 1001216sp1]MDB8813460.1 acyltransferase [Romboutsia sp. 1001216sp1]